MVIGGDENKDQTITWQDAGIAYREIMNRAFGSENTKNEWMYIAMNMSSGTSQPLSFLPYKLFHLQRYTLHLLLLVFGQLYRL